MHTPVSISIQPGQPGEGLKYNVMKPVPYSMSLDLEGNVTPTRMNGFAEWKLVGFQPGAHIHSVVVLLEDFLRDPAAALKLYPVFTGPEDTMFNLETPIVRVTRWFSDGSSLPYQVNENDEEN